MSGWIKLEKDLLTDPRVIKIGNALCNASAFHGVTVVLGALAHLWMIADTHIGNDDVIPIGVDDIDQVIGIGGFCQLLPSDWLQIVDANSVKLPNFHAHNGTIAKERAQVARRVAKHRAQGNATPLHAVTPKRYQTETETKTKTKTETKTEASGKGTTARKTAPSEPEPDWLRDLKMLYPKRAGHQNWHGALTAGNARLKEGHTPDQILEGARRYQEYCRVTGKIGTEFVMQAAKFLGPGRAFLEPFNIPPPKAGNLREASICDTADWVPPELRKNANH